MQSDTRVFTAPVNAFPTWAELRFLNETMRERLAETTGSRDRGDLQRKLSAFGVLDYSLFNVVSALVAEANRKQKDDPASAEKYRSELLTTLYGKQHNQSRQASIPAWSGIDPPGLS